MEDEKLNDETSKVEVSEKDEKPSNEEKNEKLSNEDKNDTKPEKKNDKKAKKNHYEVEIEKLQAEIQSLKDKNKKDAEEYLKARADLENIRKRLFEQSQSDRMYASFNLVGDLIQPIDMLLKIVDYKSDNAEVNNYVFGFKMISDQLKQILEKDGLKEIKALNEKFDPNFMQAMSTEKKEGVEAGIVIEVLQNGYMYKEKMLRPAMVKVSE